MQEMSTVRNSCQVKGADNGLILFIYISAFHLCQYLVSFRDSETAAQELMLPSLHLISSTVLTISAARGNCFDAE